MVKRNFPLILLMLVFLAMLDVVFSIPRSSNEISPTAIVQEPENAESFSGRVVMPGIEDIYVLENTAGRNLEQLSRFLQGRAAGLHFLSAEHFRNLKKARKTHRKKDLNKIQSGLDKTQKQKDLDRAYGEKETAPVRESGNRNLTPDEDDLLVVLRVELDSSGIFSVPEVVFADTDDKTLLENIALHIENYWRYPKSATGKLEFWLPVRFRGQY